MSNYFLKEVSYLLLRLHENKKNRKKALFSKKKIKVSINTYWFINQTLSIK